MTDLKAAATILRKDLRLRLRDRSVLLFAVIVPFGLTLLFSFILPDADDITLRAAVLDNDGGPIAAGFVDELVPALEDGGLLESAVVDSVEDGQAQLSAGDLDAVWVLRDGFSESVSSGEAATIEVLVGSEHPVLAEVARNIADTYATRLESVAIAVGTANGVAGGQLSPEQLDQVAAIASSAEPAIAVVASETQSRQLDMTSHLAVGMASFFVFFTVQWGVTGLLEEKQQGTMPRLLAAPMSPAAIHLGKMLGAAILGLVSMTVLMVASTQLLGAEFGNPFGVAVLVVAIVIAAIGVMTLVGSFARTSEQASNYQSIVAVVLGLLGGVFFPMPLTGDAARAVSALSPHRWFMQGVADLSGGASWTIVLPSAAAIVAFGIVTAIPAAIRLRKAVAW